MTATEVEQVQSAARRLVEAFGAHRRDDYFAGFAPDATFIFHSTPDVLRSRAAYEAEWDRWERDDGFHVLGCQSGDQDVRVAGDAAVFTHRVTTRVRTRAGELTSLERETIVFLRDAEGRWLAVHEHLSPAP